MSGNLEMTDEELFPDRYQRAYLNTLVEVDKENVRAWKRIVNALHDRVTISADGTASIRGVLSPMQLRAVAAMASFNQSSHWIWRGLPTFDLWLTKEKP